MKTRSFNAKDVRGILANPVYAFGILMDDSIIDWVQVFNRTVSKEFWASSKAEQEHKFQEFFQWLIDKGYVEFLGDAPTIITMNQWLLAQEKLRNESVLMDLNYEKKREVVNAYLHPEEDKTLI